MRNSTKEMTLIGKNVNHGSRKMFLTGPAVITLILSLLRLFQSFKVLETIQLGSLYVSWKLSTYPSRKPTFCLESKCSGVVRLNWTCQVPHYMVILLIYPRLSCEKVNLHNSLVTWYLLSDWLSCWSLLVVAIKCHCLSVLLIQKLKLER